VERLAGRRREVGLKSWQRMRATPAWAAARKREVWRVAEKLVMTMAATSSRGRVRSGSPGARRTSWPSRQVSTHWGVSMLTIW
jgi:hypothetical protein